MKNTDKLGFAILILAIIGGFVVSFMLSSCDDGTTDPCASGHNFPAWGTPTCAKEANSKRTCTRCSKADTRETGWQKL
ncbi:MAG: hypothetical protein LBU66_00445, partial [Treponema sp.]|nr:hypothetical protein [Treponema sp.]